MSKTRKQRSGRSRERHITVRGVRRNPPDLQKLSRALIALAMEQAAAEAAAQAQAQDKAPDKPADDAPRGGGPDGAA